MYCSRCGTQNEDNAKFCKSCGLDLTATTPVHAISTGQQEVTEIDLVRDQLKEEYEILDELGRGGMAIVFKAREKQLERDVAIKVLPFSLAFDKEFVERFQREARTSAKLEHPAIIPIYRVGKSGRVIYFVMKFLRGKPLSSLLAARGALPPGEIRRVLMEVGRALGYAHKSGIVHRDIKPDNIMFDEHGQSVVTDFGIAKAATSGKLTGTGMAIGTPHYMSPEQARAQNLDGRSDLYSLGVVAYQCLVGSVPFDGEDSFSIGYKHIMEDLPTPALDSPDKRDLFEIIKKMMAKVPDERFQNAEEMVAAIEAGGYVATGISTAATRAMPSLSGTPRAGTGPGLPGRATGTRPPAQPEAPKRSAASALLIFLVIIGALVGGGYFAYRKGAFKSLLPPTKLPADTSGVSALSHDSSVLAGAGDSSHPEPRDTTAPRQAPTGAPGTLVLTGLPKNARIQVDGQTVPKSPVDLPSGTHHVRVSATGKEPWEQQVLILPGQTNQIAVDLAVAAAPDGGDPCGVPGPAYNQGNVCFDARPVPLSATTVPLPANTPVVPRPAILIVHVSADGATLEARIFAGSNVETFNSQALDLARALRWNPATKNGDAVDAWTQLLVRPTNQ